MEIGEISVWFQFCNVEIDISDSVSTIYDEHDALFLEESLEGIDWEDDARHRADVIYHHHLDLLGVAVHKFLHT